MKILIADDNEMVREYMVTLLSDKFDAMKAVPDGRSLVAAAIELHPDVIVSDISMPVLSGPEAMVELRGQKHDCPFVFVSASMEPMEDSGVAFISKTEMGTQLIPAVCRAKA